MLRKQTDPYCSKKIKLKKKFWTKGKSKFLLPRLREEKITLSSRALNLIKLPKKQNGQI